LERKHLSSFDSYVVFTSHPSLFPAFRFLSICVSIDNSVDPAGIRDRRGGMAAIFRSEAGGKTF
jgi:hypothetical protein